MPEQFFADLSKPVNVLLWARIFVAQAANIPGFRPEDGIRNLADARECYDKLTAIIDGMMKEEKKCSNP